LVAHSEDIKTLESEREVFGRSPGEGNISIIKIGTCHGIGVARRASWWVSQWIKKVSVARTEHQAEGFCAFIEGGK
jgi:hypothetical protein